MNEFWILKMKRSAQLKQSVDLEMIFLPHDCKSGHLIYRSALYHEHIADATVAMISNHWVKRHLEISVDENCNKIWRKL